jgi:hypothetical protein
MKFFKVSNLLLFFLSRVSEIYIILYKESFVYIYILACTDLHYLDARFSIVGKATTILFKGLLMFPFFFVKG